MSHEPQPERIRQCARDLLAAGWLAEATAAGRCDVGQPLPVEAPRGRFRSWFVPVLSGDKIVGFLEFSPDLTPLRGSSFGTEAGNLNDYPDAALWLNPRTVAASARRLARPGERLGTPFLSYDQVPSRLAWSVPLISAEGRERLVSVVGETAFEGRPPSEETGGRVD